MSTSRFVDGLAVAVAFFWMTAPGSAQQPATPDSFFKIAAGRPVETVPPFQMFDNLYYIGTNDVAAYLIKTSAGLIMIDTLYDQFVDHLVPAIETLGFKPQDVKYAVVSHSHSDHWGGASLLQTRYGTRIAMGAGDWDVLDKTAPTPTRTPPRRDIVVNDGDTLTLGDTTLKLYWTPGHTAGTTSLEFIVYDYGRPYKAFFNGGYGFNADGLASLERILGAVSGVDVNIYCHQWRAAILERGAVMARRKPSEPNPFVVPGEFETLTRFRIAEARRAIQNANRPPAVN